MSDPVPRRPAPEEVAAIVSSVGNLLRVTRDYAAPWGVSTPDVEEVMNLPRTIDALVLLGNALRSFRGVAIGWPDGPSLAQHIVRITHWHAELLRDNNLNGLRDAKSWITGSPGFLEWNPGLVAGVNQDVVVVDPCKAFRFDLATLEAMGNSASCLQEQLLVVDQAEESLRREAEKRNEVALLRNDPPVLIGNSCLRVGKVWQLRFHGESGDYQDGVIILLARLLASPNRIIPVTVLVGDPDGKLAAGSHFANERETDAEGLSKYKAELEDIDDRLKKSADLSEGAAEQLQRDKVELLKKIRSATGGRTISSSDPIKKAHHNVCTQIRKFRKKLLDDGQMPRLGAHLVASLKLEFPDLGYHPPTGTPAWKI